MKQASVLLTLSLILATTLVPAPAAAQPASESLARCLSDSTTGRDRKDLSRWVFLAMAAHPEMQPYAAMDRATALDQADRAVAALFSRLLADACAAPTRAAMKEGGTVALETAFTTLGQMAMKELMSDPQVNMRMAAFQQHVDQRRVNQALTAP